MTVQVHVAFSSLFKGAAVFAGVRLILSSCDELLTNKFNFFSRAFLGSLLLLSEQSVKNRLGMLDRDPYRPGHRSPHRVY